MSGEKMCPEEKARPHKGGPNRPPRVILADDEPHVRAFLRHVIKAVPGEVAAEANNGEEVVKLCREHHPDLVLLDLNMPVKSGEEALREILAESKDVRVIMLSSSADRRSVEHCAQLGAAHYIRKDCPFEEMCEIIRETLAQPSGARGRPPNPSVTP